MKQHFTNSFCNEANADINQSNNVASEKFLILTEPPSVYWISILLLNLKARKNWNTLNWKKPLPFKVHYSKCPKLKTSEEHKYPKWYTTIIIIIIIIIKYLYSAQSTICPWRFTLKNIFKKLKFLQHYKKKASRKLHQ